MLLRSAVRRAATATRETAVPDVMVTFGTRVNRLTFVSQPGVMAVAKLLEMRLLTRPRAVLSQSNVDAIREFDEELARKCQVALDNELDINFMELEHIDKPGYLDKLKREKQILGEARTQVLSAPAGNYEIPSVLSSYERPEVSPSMRPELVITQEMFDAEPGLMEELELNKVMKSHLQNQITDQKGNLKVTAQEAAKQLGQNSTGGHQPTTRKP